MFELSGDFGGQFPWQSNFSDIWGIRQAYVDVGPADSALTFVCLHGNPSWGFLYREFIRNLSDKCRVIVPDHVGFGRSEKPTDPKYYSLERHISNLTALLTSLNVSNVVLIVHDWGGPVGMGWATRYPERVAGIVVLNTWSFVKRPELKLPIFFKLLVRGQSGYRRLIRTNFFIDTIMGRFGTLRRLPPAVLDAYRSPHQRADQRVGIASFAAMIPETRDVQHPDWMTMADIESNLFRLSDKPALIVWAEKDSAFKTPQMLRWKEVFPKSEGPIMVRAGHFLQEDAYEVILRHITVWREKHFKLEA